jgi:ABC-type microcin C transport system permease subunit YejB
MREYLLQRLLLPIPPLLGVMLVVLLMMHFIPGDGLLSSRTWRFSSLGSPLTWLETE